MKKFKIGLFLLLGNAAFAQDTLLTVDEAIKEAIENNFSIQIAKNEIEVGRINNNWATAGAYPVISATANKTVGRNNLEQKLNNGTSVKTNGARVGNTNAGLNVNWQVFDGFLMFATKKRLEELERQGNYSFQRQVNETLFNVVATYYDIVRLKQQVKATDEQIKLSAERLWIAEQRFRIGTGAKNDVLQSQIDNNEQKAIRLNLENNMQAQMVELNRLLKRPPADQYQIEDSIILKPVPGIADIQAKIESQNPDVLLAKSNLAVLVQQRREINAGRYPVVTLNGNYNFVRSSNSAGFNLFNQTIGPSGSIGVAIPLFNGGLVRRQLKVADVQYRSNQIALEQLKADLDARATTAIVNYRNALSVIDLERANFESIRENIFIATERFKKLSITSIELRQVQISYIDATTRLYNALYQAKLAEAEIYLLSGDIAKF